MEDKLRQFIGDELLYGEVVAADTKLLSTGLIDSFAILRLVDFVEENFAVGIGAADFNLENFDTVTAICRLISNKQANDV